VTIAKAPVAGQVKTRLCPPCTPGQAAELAGAALTDTLAAAQASVALERLLALEGEPGDWLPAGWRVTAQRGAGLDERLAAAFADAGHGPTLLIGMDTPQVTAELLDDAISQLQAPGVDAVLGPAPDGGYWAIGLRHPDPQAFVGVPMSEADTGERQLARLRERGLRCRLLAELRDVDEIADARAVARSAPHTRFARALAAMSLDTVTAA
jgi:rSAM/selenodomain-associated transferase 1